MSRAALRRALMSLAVAALEFATAGLPGQATAHASFTVPQRLVSTGTPGTHSSDPHTGSQPTAGHVDGGFYSLIPVGGARGKKSEFVRPVMNAPLDPDSAGLVDNLATQVRIRYGGVAGFNSDAYGTNFYVVPEDQPRHRVAFSNCQGKPYLPPQLYNRALGAHFSNVPIPSFAIGSPGTDHELSVYDPSTDQLWEFWQAERSGGVWSACWGGRIDHVSQSKGWFLDGMGATATGLIASAGAVSVRDVRRGHIDHAMALTVVDAASSLQISYPARRSDGNLPVGSPHAIAEGRRFRLDPSIDVDKLHLNPVARMIAVAAQKYGFIVTDRGGAVTVGAESGAGFAATHHGRDPWKPLLGGVPSYAVMANFPWSKLQALPKGYGRPGLDSLLGS